MSEKNPYLPELESFFKLSGLVLTLAISLELLRFEFSSMPRQEIRTRANGRCEDCGTWVGKKIIAGHLFHGTEDHLDVSSNGVGRCLYCEAKYHLENSTNPQRIGLSVTDNDSAVFGAVMSLDEELKGQLITSYPILWSAVKKRLHKA